MDRPIPFDIAAERAVLGACLMDREVILAVRNLVAVDDFYLEQHCFIYQAIINCLVDKVAPDFVTVCGALRRAERFDLVGGAPYLTELVQATPTTAHAAHYARTVSRCARQRRLIELGAEISAAAYNADSDPDALIAEAEQRLGLERAAGALADDWHGQMHDGRDIWRKKYTPRPFVVEGILPVGVTLLHGLPKTNKSWLAKGLCYAVAGGGKALGQLQAQQGEALYLNLEMDEELLNERLRVMFPSSEPPIGVKFFYDWPTIEGGALFSRLENYLIARPYTRLVIVDTLVRVLPHDEGRDGYRADARLIEPFTRFNANRGLSILLIHHSRKMSGGNDPIIGASGSTGITGSVDSVLELIKDRERPGRGLLRRDGRRIRDTSDIALKWDPQLGSWGVNLKAGEITPERRAVLDLLEEHGPMMPAKLAALMERPGASVRRLLKEMLHAGQLITMQGLYAMPQLDEDQIA